MQAQPTQQREDSDHQATAAPRRVGLRTATLLVVGSMIGSGVFTTSGFLLRDLPGARWVLLAWGLGGVLAACGALAYGELAAALPENGGEYALLSRIYHPAAGFMAGWVSLIVGFSAPTAAAAMAFGAYVARIVPAADEASVAVALIVVLSAAHAAGPGLGGRLHDAITLLDLLVVSLFVVLGMTLLSPEYLQPTHSDSAGQPWLALGSLAVGLVYVSFSYSGWNAAVYVGGEVHRPQRTLPLALLLGTGVVTVLYVLLNLVFVASAPASELRGVLEIGHVAAAHLFGQGVAPWVSAMVAIGLASSVSAALMTGPRIYERMGRDHHRLRFLSSTRAARGPLRATLLQAALAIVFATTASFDALLTYMGFTLTIVSALTVAGVFVLRVREPELPRPYRTWGHPFTTCLGLLLMLWMTAFTLLERPMASVAGLSTLGSGVGLYFVLARVHGQGRLR